MLRWPDAAISRLLWIAFLLLSVPALWVGNFRADPGVKNKDYKRPMMAFETAGSVEESQKVIDSSKLADQNAPEKFRTALMWDFLFLFLYSTSIALACFIATRFLYAHGLIVFRYGLVLMCLQFLAAILDSIENFALLRILRGPVESPWPQLAQWCAIPKFIIVFAGVLYAITGGVIWIVIRFLNAKQLRTAR